MGGSGSVNMGFRDLPLVNFMLFVHGCWDTLVLGLPLYDCTHLYSIQFFGGEEGREGLGIERNSKEYELLSIQYKAMGCTALGMALTGLVVGLTASKHCTNWWFLSWFSIDIGMIPNHISIIPLIARANGKPTIFWVMFLFNTIPTTAYAVLLAVGNYVPKNNCSHEWYATNYIMVIQGIVLTLSLGLPSYFFTEKMLEFFVGGRDILTRVLSRGEPAKKYALIVMRYAGGTVASFGLGMIVMGATACERTLESFLGVFWVVTLCSFVPLWQMYKFNRTEHGDSKVYFVIAALNVLSAILYTGLIAGGQIPKGNGW